MGNMKLEHEAMAAIIEKIRGLVQSMYEMQKQLCEQNEAMVQMWKGESCGGFLQAAVSLETLYTDIVTAISEEANLLERYHNSMLAVDEKGAKQNEVEQTGSESVKGKQGRKG